MSSFHVTDDNLPRTVEVTNTLAAIASNRTGIKQEALRKFLAAAIGIAHGTSTLEALRRSGAIKTVEPMASMSDLIKLTDVIGMNAVKAVTALGIEPHEFLSLIQATDRDLRAEVKRRLG